MYPAAVDGSQPNNYYFSPCSKMAINEVSAIVLLMLNECLLHRKDTCSSIYPSMVFRYKELVILNSAVFSGTTPESRHMFYQSERSSVWKWAG